VGIVNLTPCNAHGVLLFLFHQSLSPSTFSHQPVYISQLWKQKTVNNSSVRVKHFAVIIVKFQINNLRITYIKIINSVFTQEYWVSRLEVYKITCLCFSTYKLYEIYVFNSVQSNSRFLCTSVYCNVGTCCSSTDI